jgi:hypothetical protein
VWVKGWLGGGEGAWWMAETNPYPPSSPSHNQRNQGDIPVAQISPPPWLGWSLL